jgi:hypothetical protein
MSRLGQLGVLRIPVTIFLVVLMACIISIMLFYSGSDDERELIKFTLTVIGAGTVIYTAYYAAKTLERSVTQSKKQAAFSLLDGFNELNFTEIRSYLHNILDHKQMSPKDVYTLLSGDEEVYPKIIATMGYFEDLSIAIQTDYVDEEIIYRSLCCLVPEVSEKLNGYIKHMQSEYDNGLFIEFVKLSNCWKDGKYLYSGNSLPVLVFKKT